ncbi:proline transporter 2 [Citrus sinensis]|uniref:Proline transporter 2 n=1 Tax=Citrus sinensis TaxID=2711 RepID=A0ACB8LT62_CITSI|nr:proline transporter 2 [Citrus sinensis]
MGETNNVAALSIEAAGKRDECQNQDSGDASAHTVGQDSWQQMGLMLVISFNSGYILSYSNLILVPLGWRWGILCMFFIALYTAYTQWLLSAFHFINGQRFIRYRNLMGYHYGRQMYYVTWVLQYLTLVVANIGFILLAARSLKLKTVGKSNKHRNYELKGSKTDKVFNALGAISAAVVANAPCLLPEMQSTLSQPVVKNMRKALYVQFTVGLLFYYGIPIVGYWAYGSTASVYLPEQMSCVKWVKVFINSSVFLQSMVCQHVKANTARVKKKAWHWFNILLFSLVTVATTVAAVRMKLGSCSIMEAELWGLYQGLKLAWEHGFRLLQVEVDNLGVTQLLNSSEANRSGIYGALKIYKTEIGKYQ